jgi:hypothetical protein
MIFMSFTNFGATAGIPGVGTLYKARRRVDRQRRGAADRNRRTRRGGEEAEDDDADEGGVDVNAFDFGEDDGDDDDDENASLWDELTNVVKESARWIRSNLTPDASALEFYPSPAQLWKALASAEDGGGGRYRVPQTLLVQFDQDRVDQSAKLAEALRGSSDVRFARLRGTHLSPVSTPTLQRAGHAKRRRRAGSETAAARDTIEDQGSVLRDLRQTIVRYTTEVVTKD